MSVSFPNDQKEKIERTAVETFGLDESLVTAFEGVVTRFPSRVALGSDGWESTYSELNETANRLAHRLIASGAAFGDRAAILMSHDAPMVAAVFAILKGGQIVLSLDPVDPLSRLKLLVANAEPSVFITDSQHRSLAAELAPPSSRILNFESETAVGVAPIENPSIAISPEQTAFLTYTSGTTGVPKGVMRPHRQILQTNAAFTEAMQCTENDRIPLFAAVSTGQGSAGLCWPLLNGAMLCPFPVKTKGIAGLADWIIDRGVTVYVSSASIFRALVKTIDDRLAFSNVRAVRLASESVTTDDVRAFQKHFPSTSIFVHMFTSSETPIIAWSRWTKDDHIPKGVLPVGHVAKNVEVSLLSDEGEPVERGEVGEIVVKSRYVANGYWRDPALTAQRFSTELDSKGTRVLRTGDLGRISADGMLEFCGRKDDQIKINGNRVALGEIERCLDSLPGIDRAAVVAMRLEKHEPVLVAFVAKRSDTPWTTQHLRHTLRANLLPHMVPSRIVFLDSLPYNRGNKIDREALRSYVPHVSNDIEGSELRTETEVLLASIWAESLEVSKICRDDDFFDLGGDSLKGAVVAAQVHAALGIELSLGAIADHPTLSALAALIDECCRTRAADKLALVRVPRAASMPLSLYLESLWPACRGPNSTYVQSARITGPLDVEIYKDCLRYLIGRHEILRTSFGLIGGRPAQIIHSSAPLDFSHIDLAEHDDPEDQADAILCEAASRAIDVEALPIARYMLIKIGKDNYRLARITNQMINDGFSSRLLETELATLYEARLRGRDPALPRQAPLQYADYAVWHRKLTQPNGSYFNEAMKWWKTLLSLTEPDATRIPFKRLIRRTGLHPSEGVLPWMLEEPVAKRLDEVARSAGTTHFVIQLAVFAALIADVTGNATVVIGTTSDNRGRADAQTVVGHLASWVPIVLSYDATRTFLQWLKTVHHRVFETLTYSELAYNKHFHDHLKTASVGLPETEIYFGLSSNSPDRHFGNIATSELPPSIGTMQQGFIVYINEKKPENCRVLFDANIYGRKEMSALLHCYLRLLDIVARNPELPIAKLLSTMGRTPVRLIWARNATDFYEFVKPYYASSPLLQKCWRFIKNRMLRR